MTDKTPIAQLIARWANLARLLYSWTAPAAEAVAEMDAQIIPLQDELDARAPGWHEGWDDLPRRAVAAVPGGSTP